MMSENVKTKQKISPTEKFNRFKTITVDFPEYDLTFKLRRVGIFKLDKLRRQAEKEVKAQVKEGSIDPEYSDSYKGLTLLSKLIKEPEMTVDDVADLPLPVFVGLMKVVDKMIESG